MEIGINFNGDLSPKHIARGSKVAEAAGFSHVWVGEAAQHMHSFPIMTLVSQETKTIKVGTGIISPQLNQCHHIITAFQTLQEVYGDRFVAGLAPGDYRGLRATGSLTTNPLGKVKKCVAEFRKGFSTLPVYVGASGPKMIETGSRIADGLLMNYVNPEFLKWALKFSGESSCHKVAYGPALLKPDSKNLDLLRISAAVVLSGANKTFLEEFGLEDAASEVSATLEKGEFLRLKYYDGVLLEQFAIYGSFREVEKTIEELKALGMHQIVFATPFCRNLRSAARVGEAFSH